ncbi:hypothetical protein QBC40DRAFT_291646 [Triangularia verruculosa]|uniref:Uncharacterized protein n=1 Tax=Triangularia verruculosa TaxID=2587418 RepID=A0AAN7B275_9PEZI|nr:hypothetical protein QBC40DRAFT_291646 [Triangularia verruculosa]
MAEPPSPEEPDSTTPPAPTPFQTLEIDDQPVQLSGRRFPPSDSTTPPAPTPFQTLEIDDQPVQLSDWRFPRLFQKLSIYIRAKASSIASSSVRPIAFLINKLPRKIQRMFSIVEKFLPFLITFIIFVLSIDGWLNGKRSFEVDKKSLALSEWTARKDWYGVCNEESNYKPKSCQDINNTTPLGPPPVTLIKRMALSLFDNAAEALPQAPFHSVDDVIDSVSLVLHFLTFFTTCLHIASITTSSSPISRILSRLARPGSSFYRSESFRHIMTMLVSVVPMTFTILSTGFELLICEPRLRQTRHQLNPFLTVEKFTVPPATPVYST